MEIPLLFLAIMNVFGVFTIVNTENKFDLGGSTLSELLLGPSIKNEEAYVSKVDVSEEDVSKEDVSEEDVSEEDWEIL